MDALLTALYLHIPIVIGGVLHMIIVKQDRFKILKQPMYQPWFGANKTWRGFFLVPILTAFGALCLLPIEILMGKQAVFGSTLLLAGLVAGFGYVLAELPNSYIKRRLGIAPGETPKQYQGVFVFMDQFDSAIGVTIAYALYPGFSLPTLFWCLTLFPVTAVVVKRILYMLKLKKTAL